MADKEKKNKGGCKGKYEYWLTDDGLTLLEGWARDGLTDEQIANNMGIAPCTLYDYKNKFAKISEALKKGKEVVDIEVENALLKRAMGYKYTEQVVKDGYMVEVEKYMHPDTTAQIFWLKNRKPAVWRDKQSIDLEGVKQVVIGGEDELKD
jgi:hypothetical protein